MIWPFDDDKKIALHFFGAAQNVTGSRFMLDVDGQKVLVDCGLYQERHFRKRNWEEFPVPPKEIDAVLLTHAHLDHCGLLPKLVREGFDGPIYCTAATARIAQIILLDSAHIHEEDAAYKKRRHAKTGRVAPHGYQPLYTTEDAEKVQPLFKPVAYLDKVRITGAITAKFHDAGHVFGSSMIAVKASAGDAKRTVLFSGDVGRWDRPILDDPSLVPYADYVVVESTYGDRTHPREEDPADRLAEVINRTVEAGGNVLIPSFALERSQELLYHLSELLQAKRIPQVPVFLDSPMAIRITKVFEDHPEYFDEEMAARIKNHLSPFKFPGLTMTMSTNESKAINDVGRPCVVIAGSGMCTGGRIKHHLARDIERPQNTVLFVGYQAAGTLGRIIVDGVTDVRILGVERHIKARIESIRGFSAHADRDELVHWLSGLQTAPRKVFIVHGEATAAAAFSEYLTKQTGWPTSVPAYQDGVELE